MVPVDNSVWLASKPRSGLTHPTHVYIVARFQWKMSAGQSLVVAFFLAAACSCTPATGSSICLNDSAFPDGGEGEYAPVLLVGRYKMKMDSANEQVGASLQVASSPSLMYASTGVC